MCRHGSGELGHFESCGNCGKQEEGRRLMKVNMGGNGTNKRKNRCSWRADDQLLCDIHLAINSINIYCQLVINSEL